MELTLFIQIVSWVFGVASGLLTALRIGMWIWYNHTEAGNHEMARDMVWRGGTATFPIIWSGSVFIICVAALLAV
jgi:hypothetical protein